MKLAVIGNSHAGMLVHACRADTRDGLDLTFLARQGRGPEGLRLRAKTLRANRPDLKRQLRQLNMPLELHLPDFDGFVFVAMTATMFTIAPMLSSHKVFDPAQTPGEARPDDPERPLISEPAVHASLVADIEGNLAMRLVRKIRRATDRPIFIVRQPNPAEALLKDKSKHIALRQLHRRGEGEMAAALLSDAHRAAFDVIDDCHVLEQPAESVAHGFLTLERYTRGAGRLNAGGRQPADDILHANADYGRLVLGQVAEKLEEIRPTI